MRFRLPFRFVGTFTRLNTFRFGTKFWHKKILKEGLRLDFIDGILPEAYEERNNKSARQESTKPTCVNPLTVSAREISPNLGSSVFAGTVPGTSIQD